MVEGNIEEFKEGFQYLVKKTFSYFDVGNNSAENFYHAFILGLLVNLEGKYMVESNSESGDGRPDVMIFPKDINKKGVVIEFKILKREEDEVLEKAADEALEQIREMDYIIEFVDFGIREVMELAIVFCGKNVLVKYNKRKVKD